MADRENDVIAKAKEFHAELVELHKLASQRILPKLDTKLRTGKPDLKERALRDTFIRTYLVVGSIIKLNHYKDFHVLASITRTMFELYVDMHLLDKEKIPNGFEKFAEFTKAKKFSTAKARRNWSKEENFPFDKKFPKRAKYLQDSDEQGMLEKIKRIWNSDSCPNNWSGLSIPDRAGKLGSRFIEKCILLYDLGNWYTHSGPLDWEVLHNGKTANIIAGFAYSGACEMFRECCGMCVDHFNLQLNCANK